jgi:flagellar basal body-associated protein FliL
MVTTAIVLKVLLAVLGLAASFFAYWVSDSSEKKKKKDEQKKGISDAVSSCDMSRINAVIQRLRKP